MRLPAPPADFRATWGAARSHAAAPAPPEIASLMATLVPAETVVRPWRFLPGTPSTCDVVPGEYGGLMLVLYWLMLFDTGYIVVDNNMQLLRIHTN